MWVWKCGGMYVAPTACVRDAAAATSMAVDGLGITDRGAGSIGGVGPNIISFSKQILNTTQASGATPGSDGPDSGLAGAVVHTRAGRRTLLRARPGGKDVVWGAG